MTAQKSAQPPKTKKQKREKPALEALSDDGHPGKSKFARALGSVDYQTREKGLQALKAWLVRKTDVKESDMLKIWKGLFYCFWHSDKAPIQMELAERLAATLTQLSEESAYMFFAAFMSTMRREWFGIDRLRLDKFLMLIRKFVNRMLFCLKESKWRADLVQRYADFILQQVVTPGDTLPAAGVAYHCADILLEELRAVAGEQPIPHAVLDALLAPFVSALSSGEQVVLNRIGEGLFDTLLSELENPDGSPYLNQLDVAALAARLFELGAAPDTRARNRQMLYDLSGALERLQRKRQRIDAGAEAGPSSVNQATGKGKKKAKVSKAAKEQHAAAKEQQQAAAKEQQQGATEQQQAIAKMKDAPAPAAAPTAANGSPGSSGPGAKRQKRKAQEGPVPNIPQAGEENIALIETASPQLKQSGKKKKKQRVNEKPQAEAVAATADGEQKVGSNKPAKPAHKEPTSGQKAALRAAVAKLGQVAAAAAAVTVAAGAPKGKSPAGCVQSTQPQPSTEGFATPASSPGSASALGKRVASASSRKVAAVEEPTANGAQASKTPMPTRNGPGTHGKAMTTAKKGRVVINLKKNLYFEHGGPVPDPDIRTPPPARAKGGILKKSAKSCPPKVAPASLVLKSQAKQTGDQQNARVLPKQTRRASASFFF